MRRVRFLEGAQADLAGIFALIEWRSGSTTLAADFTRRLARRCHHLASLPGTLGRARPELRPDLRSVAHGTYLIFFRYDSDVLEVVNILEGRRDIEAFFGDEEA